jgi:hypothetical protein
MKKVLLLCLCLAFFNANAQKITKKFLVGTWTSESIEMVFSIENKKDFKIVCYSTLTKNYIKVLTYQFDKGSFYLETLYEPNDWTALAKFFLIDENTIVGDYVCDAPGQVIYKRVLDTDKK